MVLESDWVFRSRLRFSPDQIVHGQAPGHTITTIRGYSGNISASTAAGVAWALGGEYPYPATPVSIEVVSNAATDAVGNTGANVVIVQGLDANWNEQTGVAVMAGTTPAALTGTWRRVNRSFVASVGSAGRHAGTITTRVAGAGNTLSVIPIIRGRAFGISQDGVYTVPARHMFYITDAVVDAQNLIGGLTYDAEFRNNTLPSPCWISGAIFSLSEGGALPHPLHIMPAIVVSEKTDLQIITLSSSSPVMCTFSFLGQGVLVAPEYFR